jgi:hypothetical protein
MGKAGIKYDTLIINMKRFKSPYQKSIANALTSIDKQ